MSNKSKSAKPFELGNTLRDLALLRASGVDLASLIPQSSSSSSSPTTEVLEVAAEGVPEVQKAVEESYVFVQDARAAIKMHNRGDLEERGERIEVLRNQLEEVRDGVTSKSDGAEAV